MTTQVETHLQAFDVVLVHGVLVTEASDEVLPVAPLSRAEQAENAVQLGNIVLDGRAAEQEEPALLQPVNVGPARLHHTSSMCGCKE